MIERLNERILIQKCTAQTDQYLNHVNAWTDYFSCAAYASTYLREETDNVVPADQRNVTFEVRYCTETARLTSTGYRIIFRGTVYDIEGVDMMNYQKKTIRLQCCPEVRS